MTPGIELRVCIDGRPIVQSDSVRLHYLAAYAGADHQSWHELLRTAPWQRDDGEVGAILTIQVRPVETTEPPDYEERDDEPDEDEDPDLAPRGRHRSRRLSRWRAIARRTRSDSVVHARTAP